MKKLDFKFHSSDNGNCRVYYTANKRLYCFQSCSHGSQPDNFELLSCTRDGEPSCPIRPQFVGTVEPADSDELISTQFNEFAGSPAWRDLNKQHVS